VLVERLRTVLGISPGETTVDGTFSVEYTECLGRCAAAPSLMIDDEVFGGAAVERVESIIESFRDR
jgi:NADH-quinone oxidoreductase subunit E